MSNSVPMTRVGYDNLKLELKRLKSVVRPEITRAIEEARAHGDLSENAEYHAAKEKQSFNEGRIAELESHLATAEIIDPEKLSGERVVFGAHVTIVDADTEEETTYQIVGVPEADMKQMKISVTAPLARALIGKSLGDEVVLKRPKGDRYFEITGVEFK